MFSLTTTTTPASLPVTLAELKAHLRLNTQDEDDLLTAWITAATDLYQTDTREILVPTSYRLNLDRWPSYNSPNQTLYLPVYPVTAVASVQYLDTAATWQTLAGTTVDLSGAPARVTLPSTLPNLHATQVPSVRVNFTAGYSSVPSLCATVIKLIAAFWYENRSSHEADSLHEIPQGFSAICGQRRLNLVGDWNSGTRYGQGIEGYCYR